MKNKDKYDLSELDFTIIFTNNASIAGFKVNDDYGTVVYMKDYLSKNSLPKIIETSDILRDYTEWLNSETETLNEHEKRYLKDVIRPFRNRVNFISKIDLAYKCYISISLINERDSIDLPCFEFDEMYKGMVLGRNYTLEELEL